MLALNAADDQVVAKAAEKKAANDRGADNYNHDHLIVAFIALKLDHFFDPDICKSRG